jgi:Xaa-Pro aminopeptidase
MSSGAAAGRDPSMNASLAEIDAKAELLRRLLHARQACGLWLRSAPNVAWATAGADLPARSDAEILPPSLLFTGDHRYVLADVSEAPRLLEEDLAGLGFEPVPYEWTAAPPIEELRRLAGGRIITDSDGGEDEPSSAALRALRWTLLAGEADRLRALARDAAVSVEHACATIVPGLSEREVAAMAAAELLRRGIFPVGLRVGADERLARFRHPPPTDLRIERTATVAVGARRGGLVVSLTRIVQFGPIPSEVRRRHEAAVYVDAALVAGTEPGRRIGDVFRDGVAEYARQGFPDEWRLDRQGGLIGYSPCEILATERTDERVAVSQAFAWSPTITGTRSEDTILVTANGPDVLTATGEWPLLLARRSSGVVCRPDILQR